MENQRRRFGVLLGNVLAQQLTDSRREFRALDGPTGKGNAAPILAREHDACLIVDETYRDFHSADGAPHALFSHDDWREGFIHLYSFSKVFHLTGHRVGAIVTGAIGVGAAFAACGPSIRMGGEGGAIGDGTGDGTVGVVVDAGWRG